MKKLLKFELKKLLKSKYFYIIAIISFAFVIISGLTTKAINNALIEKGESVDPYSAYLFTKSALSGTYTLLVGIFVALFATEDNSNGTIKNIYARGYSRTLVYFAKYVVSLLAVIVISLLTVWIAYIYSNSVWGNALAITDNVAVIVLGQLLGICAYHAIFFAISSIFCKNSSAIALNIIGPMAVSLVLGLGDAFIKSENVRLTSYWLDSLFSNFTSAVSDTKLLPVGIALFIVYTVAAIVVGLLINRKKEI